MPQVYELVKYGAYTAASSRTHVAVRVPEGVHPKRISYWTYCGRCAGTSAAIDIRVQGAPTDAVSNALYTAVRVCRTGTAPNPIGGLGTFAQITTAGKQVKFGMYVPRYIRAITTVGGTGRTTYGVWAYIED
jgi:hypothetical protein